MGTLSKGTKGQLTGRIGDLTYYTANGQHVVRKSKNDLSGKPPSVNQLASRERMKLVVNFLKPVKDFVKIGFGSTKRNPGVNAYNVATAVLLLEAVTGKYQAYQLDYAKVVLSRGRLMQSLGALVVLENGEFVFTWQSENRWPGAGDRVMMVAYCEELQEAIYVAGGEKRIAGRDAIKAPQEWEGKKIHFYISFCTGDCKSVANSSYLGHLII